MDFDIAIKGWVRVQADTEEEAKGKASQVIEWLTAEAHERGHTEGTFFEEVGIQPLEPSANP